MPRRTDLTRKRRKKKASADGSAAKRKRKPCLLCQEGMDYVDYKDVALLRRFISERGKIRARRVTGCCAKHQHRVATAIKNAREMALLPYMTK
jgi:small subunit ribosomal protein S18